jgi:hypothetical protein
MSATTDVKGVLLAHAKLCRDAAGELPEPSAVPKPGDDWVRPSIQINEREGARGPLQLAQDLGRALAKTGVFYSKDGDPRVLIAASGGQAKLCEVDPRMAVTIFAEWVDYFTMVETKMDGPQKRQCHLAKPMAEIVLFSTAFVRELPVVQRVVTWPCPVAHERHVEIVRSGYLPDLKILVLNDGISGLDRMSADHQRATVQEFFGHFPWAPNQTEGIDLGTHLSAMMTLFLMPLLDVRDLLPGFIYSANRPRVGKTLAAKSVGGMVAGQTTVKAPGSFDDPRIAQRTFDSVAIQGDCLLTIDNIKKTIQSSELESFMTASSWSSNLLFTQKQVDCIKQCLVLLTANTPSIGDDNDGRFLSVELFLPPGDDVRDMSGVPIMDDALLVRDDVRRKMLSCLYSMLADWVEAGRPKGSFPALAGFEAWSKLVPAVIEHAGYKNPLGRTSRLVASSPEKNDKQKFLRLLAASAPKTWTSLELAKELEAAELFTIDDRDKAQLSPSERGKLGRVTGIAFLSDESTNSITIDGTRLLLTKHEPRTGPTEYIVELADQP